MTTFNDGPAKGKVLRLKRAPKFLRVVVADGVAGQQWDALDQLDDVPKLGERIFAYHIVGEPGCCHINAGRGAGGFFTTAFYALVAQHPDDATMRDASAWRAWCHQQAT